MPGKPATTAKKLERLRKQAVEVLRALREAIPPTHLRGQPAPDATWTETRDSWRRSLASQAETVLNLGGLVDALAAKANGNVPEFDDTRDCDFAIEVFADLAVEYRFEIKRARHRWRDELLKIVSEPERIRELADQYRASGASDGVKPLRDSAFCKWAIAKVRAGPATNGRGAGVVLPSGI